MNQYSKHETIHFWSIIGQRKQTKNLEQWEIEILKNENAEKQNRNCELSKHEMFNSHILQKMLRDDYDSLESDKQILNSYQTISLRLV